jgi:crotonobetainyl-CoA:carnitine CoA-transferase CaiB-like acyl-CoA transferase
MAESGRDVRTGLEALRVVDFSFGIPGAYCCKLLSDAGADVIKVEPPEGDPWRSWTAGDAPTAPGIDLEEGAALFRFLHHGVRSVTGRPGDAHVDELVASADVVVDSFEATAFDAPSLCTRHPGLVSLSITPFGRTGPYAGRPNTEFTVQGESGGLTGRGGPDQPPIMAGGRISEWVSGTFAAVAVAAAARYAQLTGHGEHIDFSVMETMNIAGGSYGQLGYQLAGSPAVTSVHRTFETPSIEPTLDGYAGFCTNSRAQFDAFLELIERRDLLGDEQLAMFGGRQKRWTDWNEAVHAWTTHHTTADVVKRAADLRIPVAPVLDGKTVFDCDHFVERGVFVTDPTGTFRAPRPAWRLDDTDPPPPRPAPGLGEHTGRIEVRTPARPPTAAPPRRLPLDGVRVVDLTAWWAGPVASGMIAALGADVIHVESIARVDGIRMTGRMYGSEGAWWERSAHYLCANASKRDLTLDLTQPAGRELLARLVRESDGVIENFTPRVMANWGLTWDAIKELNDRCILVRMPAFGLSGPWRDNSGFAQTMEQVSGLAWITGHTWDQPRIQRGPSDPNAGMHAAFALVVGLAQRDVTGRGSHFEVTMVEGALNAAAEIAIEYSAYGNVLERDGNRSPHVAPQGLYPCAGFDRWLAVSVETDEQWRGLRAALGDPAWAADPALDAYDGRRARHDALDERLAEWCAPLDADDATAVLVAHGVPAAAPRDPRLVLPNPQLQHRRFHEEVDHPVVGRKLLPTMPFRFASLDETGTPWIRSPAPLLGEHNTEILSALGVDATELAELERTGVIGTTPA